MHKGPAPLPRTSLENGPTTPVWGITRSCYNQLSGFRGPVLSQCLVSLRAMGSFGKDRAPDQLAFQEASLAPACEAPVLPPFCIFHQHLPFSTLLHRSFPDVKVTTKLLYLRVNYAPQVEAQLPLFWLLIKTLLKGLLVGPYRSPLNTVWVTVGCICDNTPQGKGAPDLSNLTSFPWPSTGSVYPAFFPEAHCLLIPYFTPEGRIHYLSLFSL